MMVNLVTKSSINVFNVTNFCKVTLREGRTRDCQSRDFNALKWIVVQSFRNEVASI